MKKYVKGLVLTTVVAVTAFMASAKSEAADYYSGVNTSSGTQLANSLNTIISKNTKDVGYSGLWSAYATTDVKTGTNTIWDMYSNTSYTCGGSAQGANYKVEGDAYNREHAVPQSWFGKKSPMVSDLFHVYPTDAKVNGIRSDYLYGEVSSYGVSYTSTNGSKLGTSKNSGYSGTVFEPADQYKGDFARTYFYMAIRYKGQLGSWTSGEAQKIFKSSYPYLTDYALDLFTRWNAKDPVSSKETARCAAVYKLQNNRNPFIDHPEWVSTIFSSSSSSGSGSDSGNSQASSVKLSSFTKTSAYMNSYVSYTAYKGSGTSNPTVSGGAIRLYQNSNASTPGGYITISASGKKITKIIIGSSMGTKIAYSVNSGSRSSNISLSAGSKYTLSNVSATSVSFYCMGTTSSQRFYVNYLEVYYQ